MMRIVVATVAAAVLTTACGAATGTSAPATRENRDRNLITFAEIQEAPGQSVYEVVQRLRPRWLSVRGGSRSLVGMDTRIVVFSDNVNLGGTEALRQIPATAVESLRFIDGATASNVLPGIGSGEHIAGAILVTRRREN